ncbi:MAG: RNA polymerase sigma factor [Gemmatimonadaceae bacterium]
MNRRSVAAIEPFESVLERHGPAVLRFCVARLGPDRGEEAFQETLLAALRHYDELQSAGAVGGWLFAIARRKIIDSARSRARAPITSDQLEEHAAAWHDPEPAGEVWSQVAALPPKQREAVALRYMADLSHVDIAEAMGTTADAARRNVFEGLKRLRRDLADDPDHP